MRERANETFALAAAGGLEGWALDESKLPACADFVAEIVRKRYPTLDVPFHARWRHFVFDGRDLWAEIASETHWPDTHTRARACFDLAVTSVLLDAGAGASWRYEDRSSGVVAARSEGLALASLRFFEWGGFSADPTNPLRADAEALTRIDEATLADAFQVSPGNPIEGLAGRARLLNRLGQTMDSHPEFFGILDLERPGGLFDYLRVRAVGGEIHVSLILDTLLQSLGAIWENRPVIDGTPLGDCWPHPELGFVPLHKLSQWLAYSLIEPLQAAGVNVTDIDGLTGLAEYRNGGLFIDSGVISLRGDVNKPYDASDPVIVGWRSLTVALLDRIAPLVRERLGVSAEQFPLARVLEGGTWAAGRELARQRRANAAPPLLIHSDGTVF